MRTFESKTTDKAFPWKVFNATFVLYVLTANLWGWTAGKTTIFYVWATLGSFIPAILLGKFIHYLKIRGTFPPVEISEDGISFKSGLDSGESIVAWNQIKHIKTVTWTDSQRKKYYPAVEVEVIDACSVVHKTTAFKRSIIKMMIRLGGGKKYRIIDEQIKDGLDELILEIEKYHPVIREI